MQVVIVIFIETQNMKTITKSQYYTLIGLRAVAEKQWSILRELEKTAANITGEQDSFGHTSDFVNGERELDDMLRILEIEVKD